MVSPLDCSFAWGFRSFISLGFQYLLYYLIPYFGRISNVMLSKFRIISIRFGFLEISIDTLFLVQCILRLALSLCIIYLQLKHFGVCYVINFDKAIAKIFVPVLSSLEKAVSKAKNNLEEKSDNRPINSKIKKLATSDISVEGVTIKNSLVFKYENVSHASVSLVMYEIYKQLLSDPLFNDFSQDKIIFSKCIVNPGG